VVKESSPSKAFSVGGWEREGGGENMNEYESEDTRAAIQASA